MAWWTCRLAPACRQALRCWSCVGICRHFVSPHPGPLPWGEGESSAVSGPHPRRRLPNQRAQIPSWRKLFLLHEGEGQGEGKLRFVSRRVLGIQRALQYCRAGEIFNVRFSTSICVGCMVTGVLTTDGIL